MIINKSDQYTYGFRLKKKLHGNLFTEFPRITFLRYQTFGSLYAFLQFPFHRQALKF